MKQPAAAAAAAHDIVMITTIVLRAWSRVSCLSYLCCGRRRLRRSHFCCVAFSSREHPLRNLPTAEKSFLYALEHAIISFPNPNPNGLFSITALMLDYNKIRIALQNTIVVDKSC